MSARSLDYLTEERHPKELSVAIAFYVLSIVAVALRLLSRRLVRAKIQWDDVLIVFAVFAYSGPFTAIYLATLYGSGRHIATVYYNNFRILQILAYVGELFYPVILTATKCSIMCLYLRLFGINKQFARVVWVSMGIAIAWGVASIFPVMLQCIPVYMMWDLLNPERKCFSLKAYFITTNTCEVFIDFAILVLPMSQVWGLKLNTGRKIGIAAIFFLGVFTTVVGIVRLVVVAQLDLSDATWNYVPVVNWSTVEMNTGIICACMPVIAPAMKLIFGNWSRNGGVGKLSFVNASTPAGASSLSNNYSLHTFLAPEVTVPSTAKTTFSRNEEV